MIKKQYCFFKSEKAIQQKSWINFERNKSLKKKKI